MRPRRRRLPVLVLLALLGAAAAVLPALASSETTPTVEARGTGTGGIYETYVWSPTPVAVSAGAAVTFTNASQTVEHGIVWTSSVKPICDSGVPVEGKFKPSWSGSCTFAQPGTYDYYCSFHGREMSGTIVVGATGTTTTTTTPSGTTTTPAPGGAQTPAPAALAAVTLPAVQKGTSVRGSANVGIAGSRLEVDLATAKSALGAGAKHAQASVGRKLQRVAVAGKVSFSVRLAAKARRALKRKRRLALRVSVKLTPPGGTTSTATRHVTLHS